MIIRTISEVSVNLTSRHTRRQNPQFIAWVDVCAKGSVHCDAPSREVG